MTGRDRDPHGRPEQARPRDALGRPLAYGSTGVEPVSLHERGVEETLRDARTLVEGGRAFSAHEVLELRWKAGPAQERDLWQGLAQLCVALVHHGRGNPRSARRLLDRAAGRLEAYAVGGGPTYGVDLAAVQGCARRTVDD
ncbi:DUF309 domain-containing protein [Nocardioidaceae bacterium]|nr:DUF309 domain-containing protein [Nocardioidaceae bacterium]